MRCLFAVSNWFVQRSSLIVNIDLSDVTNRYYTVPYCMVAKCRIGMWEKELIIGVQWFQKNPNPRVHGSVGNWACFVSHWNGGPSGWDFSIPTEHQWWILLSHIPVPALGKDKKRTATRGPHTGRMSFRDVIAMIKWRHHVASQRI